MSEPERSLLLHLDKRPGKTILTLAGRVDISNVALLIHAFERICPDDQAGVLVHVEQLDFLDASGCDAIVQASARFARRCCPLLVVGANPVVLLALGASVDSQALVWPGDSAPAQPTGYAA